VRFVFSTGYNENSLQNGYLGFRCGRSRSGAQPRGFRAVKQGERCQCSHLSLTGISDCEQLRNFAYRSVKSKPLLCFIASTSAFSKSKLGSTATTRATSIPNGANTAHFGSRGCGTLFTGCCGAFGGWGAAYKHGDYSTALRLFHPLADNGNAQAQFGLGLLYNDGLGVPQSYAEAIKWFRKAAEQGLAPAQHNLGVMYRDGLVKGLTPV
jgi:Sel1 repeat